MPFDAAKCELHHAPLVRAHLTAGINRHEPLTRGQRSNLTRRLGRNPLIEGDLLLAAREKPVSEPRRISAATMERRV